MYTIYAYIDPQNHPNVGKYTSPMECLGKVSPIMPDSSFARPVRDTCEPGEAPRTRTPKPRTRSRGAQRSGGWDCSVAGGRGYKAGDCPGFAEGDCVNLFSNWLNSPPFSTFLGGKSKRSPQRIERRVGGPPNS